MVATVMSNVGLESSLGEVGARLVRTDVGDRSVVEEMDRGGFALGGEQSGHIVVRRGKRLANVEAENRRLRRELAEAEDKLEAITSIEDELIVRYGSEIGRGLINALWVVAPFLAKPFALWLTHSAQQSAEKKNSNARSRVLRSEDYLENVLAFTGLQE